MGRAHEDAGRRISRGLLAVAAWASVASAAGAQLGGLPFGFTGCAGVSDDVLSLEICVPGTCTGSSATASAVLSQTGVYSMDFSAFADNTCCVELRVLLVHQGQLTTAFQVGSSGGGSWCAPAAPPCVLADDVSLSAEAGDTLAFVLAGSPFGCNVASESHLTRVQFSDLSITPAPPPSVASIGATSGFAPGPVVITGSGFDAGTTVAIDGQPEPVVAFTPTSLTIQPGVHDPGFVDVAVTNAFGTVVVAGGLSFWPTLAATDGVLGSAVDVELVNGSGPAFGVIAFDLAALPSPVPLGAGFFYLLHLDLASLAVLDIGPGVVPPSGTRTLSVPLPPDPGLDGLELFLQGVVATGPTTLSFTNLATIELRTPTPPAPSGLSYASDPAVYVVGQPIVPNVPSVVGPVDEWLVFPPLPAGLTLDLASGVVTGTPSAPAPPAGHLVVAKNAGGSTSVVLDVEVTPGAPVLSGYAQDPAAYVVGQAIAPNAPIVSGPVDAFSVTPALPFGLALDAQSGVISGTPAVAEPSRDYAVRATNAYGFDLTTVTIAVAAAPPTATATLTRVGNGFGQLLPHRIPLVDPSGFPTAVVIDVLAKSDLVANLTPANAILPPATWPTAAFLPNGAPGNQFLVAELDGAIDLASVLAPSASPTGSTFTGALVVLAVDPATSAITPIAGRAFVGGRTLTFGGGGVPETWVVPDPTDADGDGLFVEAADVGGQLPGLGFPGTTLGSGFAGSAALAAPGAFVFVPDADGDLTTFETFPAGRQIHLRISQAVTVDGGNVLAAPALACSTVGPDTLRPAVQLAPPPLSTPVISPGNGDVGVDPSTQIVVQFTEPIQLGTLGPFLGASPPDISPSLAITFGPPFALVVVPYSVDVQSVFDLSVARIVPAFPFPGSGSTFPGCGTLSAVGVGFGAGFLSDLAGNTVAQPLSTTFSTGAGPGLANAPVTPDAIYVGRGDGVSVVDLNGYGQGTGDPTFDPLQVLEGNTKFPYDPNVLLQGTLLVPPLAPGTCTFDGGSAGVFTLTRDTALDERLARAPTVLSATDMMLGHALDSVFSNAPSPLGCQSAGGNPCATASLKRSSFLVSGNTVVPDPSGTTFGLENPVSLAPHPNPPPLSFPPLCGWPYLPVQEPTSVDTQVPNLLVPGLSPLGMPPSVPPQGLLALEQNQIFGGPSPPQPIIGSCGPYVIRQQVGQFLYVADREAAEIVVLNSNRFVLIDRIAVSDPTQLAMSPNLGFLAVTSEAGDSVSFVDVDPGSATFHQVVQTTAVGNGPTGVAWDPGDEDVIVCNEAGNSISILSASTFQVRSVIAGIEAPFDVAITQRQIGFGFDRQVYLAYVLGRDGTLSLFESGPSGPGGVGYDDVILAAPFTFDEPRAIQPDPLVLGGGVWIAHENQLSTFDGTPTGLPGGAVTRVLLTSSTTGALSVGSSPEPHGFGLAVAQSIGSDQLTGVPVDLAFDDQLNLGALPSLGNPFSARPPAPINGKSQARQVAAGFENTNEPRFLFLAVPSSSQGGGVVDVIDMNTAVGVRFDTNPYQSGTQSIPADGITSLSSYFRQ